MDAEQARHGEPPDVGVEHPDGQAPPGHGHRQVDGDRALAHPALARGHRDHPGPVGDVGSRRRVPGQQAGPGHHRLAPLGVHHAGGDDHRPHARQPTDVGLDVGLDLGPQRAPGHREGHFDLDHALVVDADPVHHAELDDVRPELGVDHPGQRRTDRVLAGWGAPSGVGAVGPGHAGQFYPGASSGHPMHAPMPIRRGYACAQTACRR